MEQKGIVEKGSIKDLITEGFIVTIVSGDPGNDYYLLKVTE